VEAAGWWAAVAQPGSAGLVAVFATRSAVALVGCALLDEVPSGSDVPLLAVGDDTSFADQRAARDAGARGLVTWPDGVADLAAELAKAATGEAAVGEARSPVVAVRGVQGGAGTTTLAAHLAGAWARWGPAPALLADLAGGLAFRLDLVAGAWTWADVAEAATNLDGRSLANALSQPAARRWCGRPRCRARRATPRHRGRTALEVPVRQRVAVAFDELALAI
jgi:hypothetical protein